MNRSRHCTHVYHAQWFRTFYMVLSHRKRLYQSPNFDAAYFGKVYLWNTSRAVISMKCGLLLPIQSGLGASWICQCLTAQGQASIPLAEYPWTLERHGFDTYNVHRTLFSRNNSRPLPFVYCAVCLV